MHVRVRNGNVEQALRSFKRKIQNDGLILDIRGREFYEKPSDKRNRKKQAAEMRERKRDTK
jgi:small subunit ribosomal protein S21